MNQLLWEIKQSKPSKILVENVPIKEGHNVSKIRKPYDLPNSSELKWDDIIGLSWIFMDPLEEDWSF